jgi:uncharacterized membrane protein YfhO
VGVPVSVGMHRIELRYLPAPGLVGVYIMCLSWLIVALLVGYWRGRRTGRIAVKRA